MNCFNTMLKSKHFLEYLYSTNKKSQYFRLHTKLGHFIRCFSSKCRDLKDNIDVNDPQKLTGSKPSGLKQNDLSFTSDHIHWKEWILNDMKFSKVSYSENLNIINDQQSESKVNTQINFDQFFIPNIKQISKKRFTKNIKDTKEESKTRVFKMHTNTMNNDQANLPINHMNLEIMNSEIELNSWDEAVNSLKNIENHSILKPPLNQDDVERDGPLVRPTYNPAAYVNRSITLQKLVELGVDISTWENDQHTLRDVLMLDFDQHIKDYIIFLADTGFKPGQLAEILSKNPGILKIEISDLSARLNYLFSKNFSLQMVTEIITKQPDWLNKSVLEVDEKLGFLQQLFHLKGEEVRELMVSEPQLLFTKKSLLKVNYIRLKDFGFEENECHDLIVSIPSIMKTDFEYITERFDYVHNDMKISHETMLRFPEILTISKRRIKERYLFLKHLGRDQFDPNKPNYVSLRTLCRDEDEEFVQNVAFSSIETFDNFLKTL